MCCTQRSDFIQSVLKAHNERRRVKWIGKIESERDKKRTETD